ncbi:MAG: HEAT repeat domain-containing protein [Elusimicrobia bacterium]|nr:HEAT repeat domain-containing protein [Elusimicrobiota bacterium]
MRRWPSGAFALVVALASFAEDIPEREAGAETDADVPQLVREATMGDWNTRIKAVHALGRLGSIEGLTEGVTDGDWQIRLTAVHWLGRQADAGVPTLAHVVRSEPCRIVRLAAIHWLGSIGPKALPTLREALGETSPMVRLTSAYWMRKLEGGSEPGSDPDDPTLLSSAGGEDLRGCDAVNLPPRRFVPVPQAELAVSAPASAPPREDGGGSPSTAPIEEQSAEGPGKRPRAASGANGKKRTERTEALKLLADVRPPKRAEEDEEEEDDVPLIEPGSPGASRPPKALGTPEAALPPAAGTPVRAPEKPRPDPANAAAAPARGGPPAPELGARPSGAPEPKLGPVPTWHLVKAESEQGYDLTLQDPQAGRPPHDPLPELVTALRSSNWRHRYRAADLLGMMGPQAAPAVPDLVLALKDKHAPVRASAALALGNIGRAAGDSVGALTKALRDPHADVRYSAAIALGRMGTPAADRAFQRHLRAEAAKMIDRY